MRNASATEPTRDRADEPLREAEPAPEQPVDGRAEQRQERDEPDVSVHNVRGVGCWVLRLLVKAELTLNTQHLSPFQEINLVDEDRLAVAVERDDDAEADGRLGGGDDDDEDREDLTGHGVDVPGLL